MTISSSCVISLAKERHDYYKKEKKKRLTTNTAPTQLWSLLFKNNIIEMELLLLGFSKEPGVTCNNTKEHPLPT
jgi:hypothetical protein